MKRPTRIAVGIVGTLVFLLVLAVIVVKVVFTKSRVLVLLTPQLERLINRPVTIDDAGVTLWGGIGVRLEGLGIGNAPGFSNEPMMNIGSLDIKARFWPLLMGHVVIDQIVIDEPFVLIEYDAQGRSNFDGVMKEDGSTDGLQATDGGRHLSFANVHVADARFAWRDKEIGRWVDLYGGRIEADVDAVDSQVTKFSATLEFDSLMLLEEDRRIAIRAGQPSLYLNGSWNKSSRTLALDSALAEWWGAKLAASGQVHVMPSLYQIGINAKLGSVRVEELIREVHAVFPLPKFADLTATMSGTFEAHFPWPLPDNSVPDWQGRFELVDVKWPLPQTGAVVTIPRVEIRGGERSVSWSAISGQITGGTFSTSGTIDQLFLSGKTFSARLQANMPLEGTRGLLPEAWRSSLAGSLDLDITGFGSVDHWQDAHMNGRIYSERLVFSDSDWEFDSIAVGLDCLLAGHGVQVQRADMIAGDSRGAISGRIENIIPAALSGFSTPDVPHGEFDVVCSYLNLDRIIGNDATQPVPDDGAQDPEKMPLLSISGRVTADTLICNGLIISAANAPYVYKDRVFSLSPIEGHVYGGRLDGRLEWNLNTWPQPEFFTSMSADGIESNDFFSRYMGWAGGIFGRISVSGEFSGRGRTTENILPTLLARGSIDLSQARVESAPILAHVGRAIGLPGLDRPRTLSDLRLPFRIENGRIITDDLRVTWDDVTYAASGSFGFDQSLSYAVVATAASQRAPRIIQGTGLKFAVTGKVTEPVITVDAAGTARDVIDNVVNQSKDTLQKALDQRLKDFFTPRKP